MVGPQIQYDCQPYKKKTFDMDVTDREDDTMEQKEDDQYTSQRQRPGTDSSLVPPQKKSLLLTA